MPSEVKKLNFFWIVFVCANIGKKCLVKPSRDNNSLIKTYLVLLFCYKKSRSYNIIKKLIEIKKKLLKKRTKIDTWILDW